MSLVTQTTTPPQRRLSTRRGSTAAPDPFGAHNLVNLNPNRTSSSTLTIVRVPAGVSASTPPALHEPPAPSALSQRRLHRKPASEEKTRVSFAFSSFGGGGHHAGGGPAANQRPGSPSGGPPSPSSSPRLRPSSPHMSGSFGGGKPRLTPDQLVDLARQSTAPRPDAPVPHPTPATFTPLPDDIYLPFIERTSEVYSLISSPPDAKLFYILANTFPSHLSSPSPTLVASTTSESDEPMELPRDPADWTYANLIYHLTKIDRDIAPDFIWAVAARKCIISHSELLWERIKGALGVPPELDIDFDFLQDDQESPDTSDISDDEGRAAKGHWSDWDEVMDSPVYARHKRLSAESPSSSPYFGKRGEEPESSNFHSNLENKLHGLQDSGYEPTTHESAPTADETGETTIVPTPHGVQSPPEHANSPPLITRREPTLEDGEYLSIEPLIAPTTSPSGSFGPVTSPFALASSPGDALGDIAEGAEEEEAESESAAATDAAAPPSTLSPPIPEEGYVSPSQIQGLRICTSPVPPTAATAANTTPLLSPISPLPPYPHVPVQPSSSASSIKEGSTGGSAPQPIPLSRSHSRASSFSSIGPFQRSESTGNLSASWMAAAAAAATSPASFAGTWGHILAAHHDRDGSRGSQYAPSVFGSEAGDSSGYMSDGDRPPGNPLFPSNFARLAGGPTMRANHPATRGPSALPHMRYVSNATYAGPSNAQRAGRDRTYSHGSNFTGTGPASGGPATVRTQPSSSSAVAPALDAASGAALGRRQTVATHSSRPSEG